MIMIYIISYIYLLFNISHFFVDICNAEQTLKMMVLMVPFMNVRGEDQSAPKDILNNMIYSCIIFQENEIVCQVTNCIHSDVII